VSRVHSVIVEHVRLALDAGDRLSRDMADLLSGLEDDAIIRLMFPTSRGRGEDTRGLRLSRSGLEIMQALFASHDIPVNRTRPVTSREILFLERRTTKPYFFDSKSLIVFDEELAIILMMLNGDVSELMSNET
jgi:hypothetical protein